MKTTYAWAVKPNRCTQGNYVIYAGITQRPNVSDRFSGGYEFRHSDGNIRHGGLVQNKTIRVRKSEIELLQTHELKSYYDQDLMNNFHEQLYINAVRYAGEHLERLGIPVKVGNVNDVVKYFHSWRRSPEACEAGWYEPSKCWEYMMCKKHHDKNPKTKGTPFVMRAYTKGQYRTQRARRKTFWKDTDCKKFIDWCESDNDGHLCDMDVYDSIMKTVRGWSDFPDLARDDLRQKYKDG